jgi:hypothetical protein
MQSGMSKNSSTRVIHAGQSIRANATLCDGARGRERRA